MANVSQGQVYRCDFGAERGVELAGIRPALIVSRNEYNLASASVLVVPTTRGDVDPRYVDFYPPLEQFSTRASCRNLRAIKTDRLRRLEGAAESSQLENVLRGGVWPYLWSSVRHASSDSGGLDPGTVHKGFIPNHRGEVEESWFLILAFNAANRFATVAKVDQSEVGKSQVRVPLTAVDGPGNMTAYSHGIQAVDLNAAFDELQGSGYVGRIRPDSLLRVVAKIVWLMGTPLSDPSDAIAG